jgi:hypothetical protein
MINYSVTFIIIYMIHVQIYVLTVPDSRFTFKFMYLLYLTETAVGLTDLMCFPASMVPLKWRGANALMTVGI